MVYRHLISIKCHFSVLGAFPELYWLVTSIVVVIFVALNAEVSPDGCRVGGVTGSVTGSVKGMVIKRNGDIIWTTYLDSHSLFAVQTQHILLKVHIMRSEHNRDYRRDMLPTEFRDLLIVIYPPRNGLSQVTEIMKADVPWFGPLSDKVVVGGSCLASASDINASRAKRTSLSFYQKYYVERNIFEKFTARIFIPISTQGMVTAGGGSNPTESTTGSVPLADTLIDHHSRTSSKSEFVFL
ncbi:tuberin [Culex quinquefasciatus]|uniref:Tuberin n=1 Tax=Culex quinquefasciatus TaxID=7176 RepID=B0X283_CULQU|nr:tuberin [Culex quinquefasciatus]|eukprot:XP_001863755.1 tuberin [Culex quinquefasciatus]